MIYLWRAVDDEGTVLDVDCYICPAAKSSSATAWRVAGPKRQAMFPMMELTATAL